MGSNLDADCDAAKESGLIQPVQDLLMCHARTIL